LGSWPLQCDRPVADATGIPPEAGKREASADFRASLGVNRFAVVARM